MKNVSMNGIFSRNVEIFISLAKTKSFQKTASIFGLSTSPISRELVTLENKLKVTLVDRSCRPLILTPEGRKLLSELIPIMNESQRAVALAREASNFHPSLRIGFIDSFSYDVVPQFITMMQSKISKFICLTGGADRLVERLLSHEVDVILTINPCFEIPDLRRHLLLREPSVLIFPKSQYDFRRYFRSWEDLAHCGLPFIRNYSFSGGGQLESQHLTTHDLKLMGTIQTDNNGLRIKLVSDGKGWAIVRPLTLLQHEKLLSKLTIYSVPSPLIERKVYILGRSNISVDLYRDIVDSLANILNSEVITRLTEIFSPTIVKSIEVYPYTNK